MAHLTPLIPPEMEFLSLTEPVLALCVEVDREACELRYADPFPELVASQNVAMTRRGRSRVFFFALHNTPRRKKHPQQRDYF